jgi:hypothetical protein
MKIEPGYWRTRDGRKAQVLLTDIQGLEGKYSAVGVLSGALETWTANGSYWSSCEPNTDDLLEPWREPASEERVVYLVRFASGHECCVLKNVSDSPPQFSKPIGSTRVTVTEGVFA